LTQRWTVDAATLSISAAFCTVTSSPSSEAEAVRSHRGISQRVRRLQTRFAVKPIADCRLLDCRLPTADCRLPTAVAGRRVPFAQLASKATSNWRSDAVFGRTTIPGRLDHHGAERRAGEHRDGRRWLSATSSRDRFRGPGLHLRGHSRPRGSRPPRQPH
jgi:hypothetical protein